jgi:hypothetical protein
VQLEDTKLNDYRFDLDNKMHGTSDYFDEFDAHYYNDKPVKYYKKDTQGINQPRP